MPKNLSRLNRFSTLCESAEPEDICEVITSGILDSVKENLPLQISIKPQWMSPKTKATINTKPKTRKEKVTNQLNIRVQEIGQERQAESSRERN